MLLPSDINSIWLFLYLFGTEMPPKVPKTFFLDGVCLSETGLSQIRALSLKFTEKKQRPRWRRNPSMHPALLMMMSEKSEDDQENADSKTAAVGLYWTATEICPINLIDRGYDVDLHKFVVEFMYFMCMLY